MNWQSIKKPTYTAGRIVFNSDDGRLWDYSRYFKTIQKAITQGNQFNPSKSGIFCPAVNTAYTEEKTIGMHESVGQPVMSWQMLKEIANKGGEILSHGKWHLYMSGAPISQALEVGATRIYFNQSNSQPIAGIKLFITDGKNRDDFTVSAYTITSGNNGYMDIDTPLTHSYTTSATINVHEGSMALQLGGIVKDLANHGIVCKHHINAWYYHSPTSLPYLKQYFESVLIDSQSSVAPNYKGKRDVISPIIVAQDLYNIKRQADLRHFTTEDMDILVENLKSTDGVSFIQMHGAYDKVCIANIDYLITKALSEGVRIVTHDEAIQFLKSKIA